MTPLMIFTMAWAVGVWAAHAILFPPVWLLLALPALAVLHVGWRDSRPARRGMWALAGFALGAGRMFLAAPHIDAAHVAFYNGVGRVEVVGVVVAEPDVRPHVTNLRVRVEQVTFPGGATRSLGGQVLVKASPYLAVGYGDRVRVVGPLETPPVFETFSYRDYLARRGIHALIPRAEVTVLASHQASPLLEALYRFKAHALRTLLTLLPEPQASLLAGILLGVESGIPADLRDAFIATGTSHIVAISGFNMSLVAAAMIQLARRLAKGRGELPLALGGIWLYTLLVGASAAVVRAAVMATVALVARKAGRRIHGPTSLAAAVWVMLTLNPYTLWDAGFQLSVAATLGMLLYVEPLSRRVEGMVAHLLPSAWVPRAMALLDDALVVTLAAQITTMGIVVGIFRRLSLVSLLTNLLILPLQPFVMLLGGAALLTGLAFEPLGQAVGWGAWVFLTLTIEAVRWTATFPWASIALGRVTLIAVWGYYAGLAAITWWLRRPPALRRLPALRPGWAVAGLMIGVLFPAYLYLLPDGRLHVYVLDVGGEAVLIETPTGGHILVNGGPDGPRTLACLGRQLPFWKRYLDGVVLTSPDEERLAGLIAALERYDVGFVLEGNLRGSGASYARWRELVEALPAGRVGYLPPGEERELGGGVTLQWLWPPPDVPGPVVLRLSYGEISFLLAGSATTKVEEQLVARYGEELRSAVLLFPRYGSPTAGRATFVGAVSPSIIVVAAREGKPPDPRALARVADREIYRTDVHGTIEVVADGNSVHVRTGRE